MKVIRNQQPNSVKEFEIYYWNRQSSRPSSRKFLANTLIEAKEIAREYFSGTSCVVY